MEKTIYNFVAGCRVYYVTGILAVKHTAGHSYQ